MGGWWGRGSDHRMIGNVQDHCASRLDHASHHCPTAANPPHHDLSDATIWSALHPGASPSLTNWP